MASLYEQLNEKTQLNQVMRLELETLKRAVPRARATAPGMLHRPTVRRVVFWPRVATHLENLEKSGNSKVVREKSGETEIIGMTKGDQEMLSGNSGMQENLLAAGALPRTPLGELSVLPRMP